MRLVRGLVAGAAALIVALPTGALASPGADRTTTPRWTAQHSQETPSARNTYRIVDDLRSLPKHAQAVGAASTLSRQWAPQRLGAPSLWSQATGAGVTVAVIDTGVDGNHPDLRGRVLPGAAFLGGSTTSLGNGWNDSTGHGTFLAGLIAAQDATGQGVAGLAPGVSILPVRVFSPDGSADELDIATGVLWAAEHGAQVINLSLGSPDKDTVLADAIAKVSAAGVLVVASAGNAGAVCTTGLAPDECGDPVMYPAADPGVLGVGAIGREDVRPDWSESGWSVDVVAPGVDVASTSPRGTYSTGDGTSFASPYVSAAAALLLERYPTLTPAQLQGYLMTSAVDLGATGPDDLFGWGLVSPTAALASAARGSVAVPAGAAVALKGLPSRAFYGSTLPAVGSAVLGTRPVPGVRLSLSVRPAAAWTVVGSALTGDDGLASFKVPARTAGYYAVAPFGAKVSATSARLWLLPSVSLPALPRGRAVVVRGTVASPEPGGLTVTLRQLVGGTWRSVASTVTTPSGTFAFPARAVSTSTTVYRVLVPAQKGLGAVATGAVYARR